MARRSGLASLVLAATMGVASQSAAADQIIFQDSTFVSKPYGNNWCDVTASVTISTKSGKGFQLSDLQAIKIPFENSVAQACHVSRHISLYSSILNAGPKLVLIAKTDKNGDFALTAANPLIIKDDGTKKGWSDVPLGTEFADLVTDKAAFAALFFRLSSLPADYALTAADRADIDRVYNVPKLIEIINGDPQLATLAEEGIPAVRDAGFSHDAQNEPRIIKASAAVASAAAMGATVLVATIIFYNNPQSSTYFWDQQIKGKVSVKAQDIIIAMTKVIGERVRDAGGATQDLTLQVQGKDEPSGCAQEVPKALAEAEATAGKNPPARMIIPTDKIGTQPGGNKYTGKGWEKWSLDYRNNGLFIQIHYMYQPSSGSSEDFKKNFCKADT